MSNPVDTAKTNAEVVSETVPVTFGLSPVVLRCRDFSLRERCSGTLASHAWLNRKRLYRVSTVVEPYLLASRTKTRHSYEWNDIGIMTTCTCARLVRKDT